MAGFNSQQGGAIGIGQLSGQNSQQQNAIAIGTFAGQYSQQQNSIAIGYQSGYTGQGTGSIAIGFKAGQTNQSKSSIVLNAAGDWGLAGDYQTTQGFFVAPVRLIGNNSGYLPLYYSTISGEIVCYDSGATPVVPTPDFNITNPPVSSRPISAPSDRLPIFKQPPATKQPGLPYIKPIYGSDPSYTFP